MHADHAGHRLRLVEDSPPRASALALLEAGLDMAYQPIVHLGSGSVIAYEALARPRHPMVSNPMAFFGSLDRAGLRLEGERVALKAALDGLRPGRQRVKLFVNASPSTLVDPAFDMLELIDLVDAHELSPSDLVIEVTESEAVEDLEALSRCARRLARLGVCIAVDDAGAGHASFRVITRLRPAFIKLDRDLVTGVDGNGARHAFIEAMVRFSRQIGSRLVAEGIETEGELASLAGLGVEAGQGHFLARPVVGSFPSPSVESRRMIASAAQRLRLGAARISVTDLSRPATVVDGGLTVRQAYARFQADPSLGVLAMVDSPQPAHHRLRAQLTRRALERYLAVPGSWEALADHAVGDIADHQPVAVLEHQDLMEVGAMLAAREAHELIDDVLVTDARRRLVGVVPIRDIIRALAEVRQPGAQDLNPLSGLVGPGWVEAELARRLESDEAVTVVFVDLDQFHIVNDLGGFSLGDDVIRAVGRCVTGVAGGVRGAAAAHVGGDDFLLLVPPQGLEELLSEIVRTCENEALPFLRTELSVRAADHLFDQVAVSIAAVDLDGAPPPGHRYLEWAQSRLAGPMLTAKEHAGYVCVHASGGMTHTATWSARGDRERTLSVGRAEPSVVLGALALIDESFDAWFAAGASSVAPERFPGPRAVVEDLTRRHLDPLARAARTALGQGRTVVDVNLTGDESELLGLLDRVAAVTRDRYAARRPSIPAEYTLVGRLLRRRARVLTREDVTAPQDLVFDVRRTS